MDQSTLNRVTRIVRSILPSHFDTESIAMDILVESWSNQIDDPSYSFIRNRCIDELRDRSSESAHLESASHEPRPRSCVSTPEDRDSIEFLTQVLTQPEKKAIYYRFQLELSQAEVAQRMNLAPASVRELVASAVYKMREATS